MAAKKHRSLRWKTTADYDADAFFLEKGDWFVFVYLKNPNKNWDQLADEIINNFERGDLRGVGGARKTKDGSEPLPPKAKGGAKVPDAVWAYEGGLQFRLETKDVLNPGFFLDQECNRQKLGELTGAFQAPGKPLAGSIKLLNLFSYTGAFSVVASCLGVETTSVDVSSRYLDWEKRNQGQNSEVKKAEWGSVYPTLRLLREDAREYVRKAVKRGEKYTFVIIDPPTFSKSDGEIFQVQKDLMPIVQSALPLLEAKGSMLVSTNDGQWPASKFFSDFEEFAKAHGLRTERGELPAEYTSGDPKYPLKSIWLHR